MRHQLPRRTLIAAVLMLSVAAFAIPIPAQEKVEVTGEVIESSCYIRTGARGESHRKCAQLCADNGIPLALLEDGTEKVIWLGNSDHMTSPNKLLRPYIAKKVKITGRYVERGATRLLIIDSIEQVKAS